MKPAHTVKKSHFRQSAWKDLDTGEEIIRFGHETAPRHGRFQKLYVQDVTQVTVVIPVLDESKPHQEAQVTVKAP